MALRQIITGMLTSAFVAQAHAQSDPWQDFVDLYVEGEDFLIRSVHNADFSKAKIERDGINYFFFYCHQRSPETYDPEYKKPAEAGLFAFSRERLLEALPELKTMLALPDMFPPGLTNFALLDKDGKVIPLDSPEKIDSTMKQLAEGTLDYKGVIPEDFTVKNRPPEKIMKNFKLENVEKHIKQVCLAQS